MMKSVQLRKVSHMQVGTKIETFFKRDEHTIDSYIFNRDRQTNSTVHSCIQSYTFNMNKQTNSSVQRARVEKQKACIFKKGNQTYSRQKSCTFKKDEQTCLSVNETHVAKQKSLIFNRDEQQSSINEVALSKRDENLVGISFLQFFNKQIKKFSI